MNAAEPGEAGSSKNVGEHGFGLIVGRVGDGDVVAHSGVDERAEVIITGAARGVFEISAFLFGFLANISGSGMKLEFVFRGQLGDKIFIRVGSLASQFVIEVRHARNNSELLAQFQQQQKQRHRICAARNCDAHTLAGARKLLRFDVLQQLLAQRRAHG